MRIIQPFHDVLAVFDCIIDYQIISRIEVSFLRSAKTINTCRILPKLDLELVEMIF